VRAPAKLITVANNTPAYLLPRSMPKTVIAIALKSLAALAGGKHDLYWFINNHRMSNRER